MELITVTVPLNFNLFFIGDVHLGSKLCNEGGFIDALQMTKKKYKGCSCNHIIGMGDYCDSIDVTDKRFDTQTVKDGLIRPDRQYEYCNKLIKPFKDKFDVLNDGNHDWSLSKYHEYVKRDLCKDLGIPFGTYTSIISYKLKSGKLLFKVFVTHGRKSINSAADDVVRRESNMILALKRHLKNKVGDCVIMAKGHTHKLLISEPKETLYMVSDEDGLHQNYRLIPQNSAYIPPDHRMYINTGSFLKAYERGVSGYAERAEYDPMELGFPAVTIRNGIIKEGYKEIV